MTPSPRRRRHLGILPIMTDLSVSRRSRTTATPGDDQRNTGRGCRRAARKLCSSYPQLVADLAVADLAVARQDGTQGGQPPRCLARCLLWDAYLPAFGSWSNNRWAAPWLCRWGRSRVVLK